MAARHQPTSDDRRNAIDIALSGLARGDDLADLAERLEPLHPRNDTFPGEMLLDLAADAIDIAGATRKSPIDFEGIRDRYLPDAVAHTKAQHHKSKYALRAAAMLRGGVDPGLLDEVQWWRSDDFVVLVAGGTGRLRESRCRPHWRATRCCLPSDRPQPRHHPHRSRRSLIVTRRLDITAPQRKPARRCPFGIVVVGIDAVIRSQRSVLRACVHNLFVVATRRSTADDETFIQRMLAVAADWRPGSRSRSIAEVMATPELAHYVADWPRSGDLGFVATDGPMDIGAAWWRLFPEHDRGYGFVDDKAPELSIGVVHEARRRGVGTLLLRSLIEAAQRSGLPALSLSVERDNPAVSLYERLGFEPVRHDGGSLTMVLSTRN